MEDVQSEAKQIMDRFSEVLEQAQLTEGKIGLESDVSMRDAQVDESDEEFVHLILSNATKVKDDCIVAEKKSW